LGKLYIRWDFLNEAVAVLQAGIAKVTDSDQASDLHYHLGLALSGQNKHAEAVAAYTKSIELRKGNLDALRQRGYAYLAMGDKAKAKEELTSFVKSGGGTPFEVQTVNQTLFRLAVEEPTPPPTP
jgi:tetratricopeptide (TPR) repeat protein